jgi:hypothetical protein
LKLTILLITILSSAVWGVGCGDGTNPLADNGEECIDNGDCQTDDCRQELAGYHPFFGPSSFELPGGMCTATCEWDLSETDIVAQTQGTCEDNEWCLGLPGGDPVCFQSCTDSKCDREGYTCQDVSNGFFTCLPEIGTTATRVVDSSRKTLLSAPALKAAL